MRVLRFPLRLAAALCLAPLAGCGVPDGIAYGVKAVQHYNERPVRAAATPAIPPRTTVIEAPASTAPAPVAPPARRESIVVEELPPAR